MSAPDTVSVLDAPPETMPPEPEWLTWLRARWEEHGKERWERAGDYLKNPEFQRAAWQVTQGAALCACAAFVKFSLVSVAAIGGPLGVMSMLLAFGFYSGMKAVATLKERDFTFEDKCRAGVAAFGLLAGVGLASAFFGPLALMAGAGVAALLLLRRALRETPEDQRRPSTPLAKGLALTGLAVSTLAGVMGVGVFLADFNPANIIDWLGSEFRPPEVPGAAGNSALWEHATAAGPAPIPAEMPPPIIAHPPYIEPPPAPPLFDEGPWPPPPVDQALIDGLLGGPDDPLPPLAKVSEIEVAVDPDGAANTVDASAGGEVKPTPPEDGAAGAEGASKPADLPVQTGPGNEIPQQAPPPEPGKDFVPTETLAPPAGQPNFFGGDPAAFDSWETPPYGENISADGLAFFEGPAAPMTHAGTAPAFPALRAA